MDAELARIKQQEADALAAALGMPVAPKKDAMALNASVDHEEIKRVLKRETAAIRDDGAEADERKPEKKRKKEKKDKKDKRKKRHNSSESEGERRRRKYDDDRERRRR